MEETVKTRRGPLAWVKKHKKLTALLIVVIIVAVLVLRAVLGAKKATGTSYQYVRTTTLQKTSLTDSVSVNGTVKSGDSASVTAADSVKTYKVTSVNVAVGDTVKKGDVIATLDTTDVEKQIEKAEQNYSDTLQSAQTSKDRAESDLEVSTVQHENNLIDLQDKISQADDSVQTAKDNLVKAQENERAAQGTYDAAVSDYNDIKSGYDSATASITTYTDALNAAADAQNAALAELNSAIAAGDADAQAAAQAKLDEANANYQSANDALTKAQNECSVPSLGLYGYNAISAALSQAENTKDSAEKSLDSAKDAVTSAEQQVENAEQQVKSAHDS